MLFLGLVLVSVDFTLLSKTHTNRFGYAYPISNMFDFEVFSTFVIVLDYLLDLGFDHLFGLFVLVLLFLITFHYFFKFLYFISYFSICVCLYFNLGYVYGFCFISTIL